MARVYVGALLVRMTRQPYDLIIRPKLEAFAAMDPLSEVLRSVRLAGGVFLSGHFTAPWCISVRITPADCAPFMKNPAQMIAYHVVIEGEVLVGVDDSPMMAVRSGEIVLFPRNDPHILANEEGLAPVSAGPLIQKSADGGLYRIRYGGGGATSRIFCGFLANEEKHNPLISTLPKTLKIDVRGATAREWIEASVRFAAGELAEGRLASSSVMSRLSESLFTEAVRQYSSTADEGLGWLKGLKDPYVGRALALIHQKMNAPWTTNSLASEIALSRSAFVERFTSLVGLPPIRYLTVWRLQTAKLDLQETHKTIAQVAHAVGYDSEEAFSRAFKREFGASPSRWRERHAAG
ncbi:MAG TPA: AraC family transcriptional regulator [Pseudolabrys sp.]|nr:AraC family transcriptional regulator [Pseudolabrys sp.]